jgi:hypothetical protein
LAGSIPGPAFSAYDIAFFDEFARAAGWTERLSLENPEFRPPS